MTAPPLPARPLGRTSGSMKRHPDLPSTDRLNPAGSSHDRSVSQPELSLPNFGAGEREAWDSDRPKSVPLEPPGSPTNPGATLGSGLTRLITKTSIAQLFSKSRADIAVTSPSTSTLHSTEEEEEQVEENTIAGADREPVEPNDDFQTDELQRAIDESIREGERNKNRIISLDHRIPGSTRCLHLNHLQRLTNIHTILPPLVVTPMIRVRQGLI